MRQPWGLDMRRLRLLLIAMCVVACRIALAGEFEWQRHMDAGHAADQRRDYRTAAAEYQNALREAEVFGEKDRRLARTLNSLALARGSQGQSAETDRKSTRLNSSHSRASRMPSSA